MIDEVAASIRYVNGASQRRPTAADLRGAETPEGEEAEFVESYRPAGNRVTISPLLFQEALMQTVAFKAGDTIIREGDEGDTAFFIVDGSVEVSVGQGAKARTVGTLKTGEVFGEMCLIEPGPRSATVKAVSDTECLATSYEEFISAIEDHPQPAVGFMKTLVRRPRPMNERMPKVGPDRPRVRAVIRDC